MTGKNKNRKHLIKEIKFVFYNIPAFNKTMSISTIKIRKYLQKPRLKFIKIFNRGYMKITVKFY